MIWIFNLEKASACACDSFDDLFQYLLKLEDLKSPEATTIELLDDTELGKPILKKQWCLNYCNANNYVVIESFTNQKIEASQLVPLYTSFSEAAPSLESLESRSA